MFESWLSCLKKYADFSGCSARSEYWYFSLMNFLIGLILFVLDLSLFSTIFNLLIFVPGLAVFVRRMHDINRSGWNYFWILLPIIGWIVLFVYTCLPSVTKGNKYTK